MRSLYVFFASLASPLAASAASILLPLYVYPVDNAGNQLWTPVYNAISAHPSIDFIIVINCDSGPGSGTLPNGDDGNYITAIEKLHSFSNVQLIGYVHTLYKQESLNAIQANVSTYAGWKSYTGGNIAMSGIFVDEVTNDDSDDSLEYIANVSSIIRSTLGASSFITYNPGAITPADYFTSGTPNLIVEVENTYASFQGANTIAQIPKDDVGKSAIILNEVPSTADIQGTTNTIVQAGVGALWFTDAGNYNDFNLVSQVVTALDNAQ